MNKRMTDSLAQFCVVQRDAFSVDDWLTKPDVEPAAVGLAATYLSMTSWYGHEDDLQEVAKRNNFCAKSTGLYRESKALHFDLPYFSVKVRAGVARCQRNGMKWPAGSYLPHSIERRSHAFP